MATLTHKGVARECLLQLVPARAVPLHGKEIDSLGSNLSLGMPLTQWPIGKPCASCFDAKAEKAGVRYGFVDVLAQT
jgi:hypothetical protein